MSKLFEGFSTVGESEMDDFEVIPAGTYTAMINKSEMKENKQKTGSFLNLHFKVTEGKFKDRMVFINLNLIHPNEQAVQIARKTLTSICKACGLVSIEETEELHGIEMEIKVTVKAESANFPASNEIKGFKSLSGVSKPKKSSDSETELSKEEKIAASKARQKTKFD